MKDIPPRYNPQEVEQKIYAKWEQEGFFHAETSDSKRPFTIVIPPPNITGILHIGHALNNTLQDILIRWKRMQGFESLWMPGTDHAGIATQNVVEKKLANEGKTRDDLGREEFLKEVWKWRNEYGSTIIHQLKRLGSSCDWKRVRFTMDEPYSKAVMEVFVSLWNKGLIYQGDYIINWCPRCQTALSDEEAPHQEVDGRLYYIKYPFKETTPRLRSGQGNQSTPLGSARGRETRKGRSKKMQCEGVVVATTRPETMLGDTAVAVNPMDKRYKKFIGKTLVLPLVKREIPIIADGFVDKKFGTGAVKVTPAHDPNDFDIGNRHKLERVLAMDPDGTMNENAGDFKGMDRFKAREAVIEALKKQGLLVKIEPYAHAVGHCYRCSTMIEPYLSRQWFVKMKPLAKPAIEAVKKGRIKFYPKRWTKVYLNWMENIRDWCISRQIWWGHRLPVYYCKNCIKQANGSTVHSPSFASAQDRQSTEKSMDYACPTKSARGGRRRRLWTMDKRGIIVSKVKPEKCPVCNSTDIYQDENVLDTWFSSWLWPFATLGWPEERWAKDEGRGIRGTKDDGRRTNHPSSIVRRPSSLGTSSDLRYFYPTSVLVTAPEILFFWVARMIMAGMEFIGDIPFRDVYIHGTVRDLTGKKMSKSLGNIIDPIDIIDGFGADALRYSMIAITSTGQDVFLSEEKFELGRNFANKIWNASRFVLMNVQSPITDNRLPVITLADRWILSKLNRAIDSVNKALESYRFNEAEAIIYDFFWHEFCDWYVEMVKQVIIVHSSEKVLMHVLESSLKLLHPFMPFVTEAVWQNIMERKSIMIEKWPEVDKKCIDKKIEHNMEIVKSIVVGIRNIRSDMDIAFKQKLRAYLVPLKKGEEVKLKDAVDYIKHLAQLEDFVINKKMKKPKHCASAILEGFNVFIPLEGLIDIEVEKSRLAKKKEDLEKQVKFSEKKLKDKNFIEKAPEKIVEQEKEKKQKLKNQIERLKLTYKEIKCK